MRRHVENQIEKPDKNSLGILILFAMWALALMVLSSAAHGQDPQPHLHRVRTGTFRPDMDHRDGAQQRLLPVAAANAGLDQPGTDQVILTRFLLISIPDRQLALVDNGQVVKIYPIAVGANHSPSPEGNFTIISRVAKPTWSHKGKVVAPGKNNPVGSRWMGLSLKGYGIHGTNAPRSIGKAASHGCFRMGKKDVEELFTLARVGDTVAVRSHRDDLVAQVFGNNERNGEVQVASVSPAAVPANAVAQNESR
jgi:hypothetical protein